MKLMEIWWMTLPNFLFFFRKRLLFSLDFSFINMADVLAKQGAKHMIHLGDFLPP